MLSGVMAIRNYRTANEKGAAMGALYSSQAGLGQPGVTHPLALHAEFPCRHGRTSKSLQLDSSPIAFSRFLYRFSLPLAHDRFVYWVAQVLFQVAHFASPLALRVIPCWRKWRLNG